MNPALPKVTIYNESSAELWKAMMIASEALMLLLMDGIEPSPARTNIRYRVRDYRVAFRANPCKMGGLNSVTAYVTDVAS